MGVTSGWVIQWAWSVGVLSRVHHITMKEDRRFEAPRLLISEQYTLPELVDHMRQGHTVLGTTVKPYPWLDYATRPKSDTELRMENLLTGCTFKTLTSCVLGKEYSYN